MFENFFGNKDTQKKEIPEDESPFGDVSKGVNRLEDEQDKWRADIEAKRNK